MNRRDAIKALAAAPFIANGLAFPSGATIEFKSSADVLRGSPVDLVYTDKFIECYIRRAWMEEPYQRISGNSITWHWGKA